MNTAIPSLDIRSNVPLQNFNTLALPVSARFFCQVDSVDRLVAALAHAKTHGLRFCILGGGSNTVFSDDFSGLVIQLALRGIQADVQDAQCFVSAAAGENWDDLVRHCLLHGWYGIENLIAIPGSVGAAPIQNIGAYGVELSQCLAWVRGIDVDSLTLRQLSLAECELGYRDSVFKGRLRDRFIITELGLQLSTEPRCQLGYPALAQAMSEGRPPSPELIAQTIEVIRAGKLPDPRREPNAGSFFKNPILDAGAAKALITDNPSMAHWPMADGRIKLAAAWLVEACGWKGKRVGGVGVHPMQAIVLVNYDQVAPSELLALASAIQTDVAARFGVWLDIEPRIYE